MNEKFVKALYKEVIESGIDEYKNLLDTTEVSNATDPCWISALGLYNDLTSEQKDKMLEFARLIMIDTISTVFGVMDGSSNLQGESFEFEVSINGENTDNELQDTFLCFVEENEK